MAHTYHKPKVERFGTLHEVARATAGSRPEGGPLVIPRELLRDVEETQRRDETVTRDRAG